MSAKIVLCHGRVLRLSPCCHQPAHRGAFSIKPGLRLETRPGDESVTDFEARLTCDMSQGAGGFFGCDPRLLTRRKESPKEGE